ATVAISRSASGVVGRGARGRVTVVRYGLDLDRFRPGAADPATRDLVTARRPDAFVVAVFGRIDPEKGHRTVVRAVAELDDRTRLVIVGREQFGSEAFGGALREEANDRLGQRVSFLEPTDDV